MPNVASLPAKPRILFYLPVVTPWWFTNIILPFVRAAYRGGEVHVLVPPLWGGTGITFAELQACDDLGDVQWHILDRGDHADLRFSGLAHASIHDIVNEIDPDVCLCRSADLVAPAKFPGVVRYIMEGATPPFSTPSYSTQLTEGLFDHGFMPDLDPALENWLDTALAPYWEAQKNSELEMERADFLDQAGLPADKLLLAMPLEYEHEEIYWDQHYIFANNIELVDALANALDDDTVLAITQHPLNEGSGPAAQLRALVERHAGKVRLVPQLAQGGQATTQMIKHCDGTIFCNSKSFANAAFYRKPMLRISKFATGDWLNAYTALAPFIEDLRAGTARVVDETVARRWFAFHHANCVVDPRNPAFDAHALRDQAVNPVNTDRWREGLARFQRIDASLVPLLPALDDAAELPLAVGM